MPTRRRTQYKCYYVSRTKIDHGKQDTPPVWYCCGHTMADLVRSGLMLDLDAVVRLRRVQLVDDDGEEETAIAAYWISDGVD